MHDQETVLLDTCVKLLGTDIGTKFFNKGLEIPPELRLDWFDRMLTSIKTRNSEVLKPLSVYKIKPVSIREFIENPYYMGPKAPGEPIAVYDKIITELEEINSGKYVECCYTGGIGCYPYDSEFLTPTGWKRFCDYEEGDLVSQYNVDTRTSTFVEPLAYINLPSDGWYTWRNKRSFSMKVSPEHRVLWNPKGNSKFRITCAKDLAVHHWGLKNGISGTIPSSFIGGAEGIALSDDQLKLMVAFLADGNIHSQVKKKGEHAGNRRGRITIRKLRKIERVRALLDSCNISYTISSSKNRPEEVTFWFYPPIETKSYSFLWGASQHQLNLIVSELRYWDGLFSDEELRFHTTDKDAADFVQYAWVATGHKAYIGFRSSESRGGRKALYIVTANNKVFEDHTLADTICEFFPSSNSERKYCFTVPTGFLVIRQDNKVFISGNSGKTTAALYTLSYQLYLLSCMKDPHGSFGLDKASEILIVFQSLNAGLSKALDYARFKAMVDNCPYFTNHFPYNKAKNVSERLIFPNRIEVVPLSGLETAAIGQNVISALLDEVNYLGVIQNSKKSIDGGTFDQAVALYNSIARRRKSRFQSSGSLPGILCLVSSKRYPGQFTDLKEEEAKRDPTIYIYDKRVWDVKPDGSFSGVFFEVFVGDESRKPRILGDTDYVDPKDRHLVDHIPIEFKEDFTKDITNALREIAGKSTLARHPFIMDTEAISKSMCRNDSIFSKDSVDFVIDQLEVYPDNFYKPEIPRYAHIDLGITGDSAGLVVGTITGFKKISRSNAERFEILPQYYIDGALEVRPPKGGEILFWKIRDVLYALRDLGLNIRWVSFDTMQSRDSQQLLKQKGFFVGTLSMDVSSLPYEITKAALYDGRVSMPYHKKLQKELASLEFDSATGRVDHPKTMGGCFTADTIVKCVGGDLTFEQLIQDYSKGLLHSGYAFNHMTNSFEVVTLDHPRITKTVTKLVELQFLVRGQIIILRCTPEHLIMLNSGEYTQAQYLTEFDDLMEFDNGI